MSRNFNRPNPAGLLGCLFVAPIILLQIFLALAVPTCILGCLVAGGYYLCTGEFILQ